jgi:hypothetical protein
MHGFAVEAIHATEELSNSPEQLHTRIDVDVTFNNADSMAIVNSARGLDFLLSIAMEKNGEERGPQSLCERFQCQRVSVLKGRSFSCQH